MTRQFAPQTHNGMSVVLVCLLCLAGTVCWLFHHYCHAVVLQIIISYFSFPPLSHILYRHTNQASVVKRWLVLSTGRNSIQWIMQCGFHNTCAYQAAVVPKMDSAIHWINLYPVDSAIIIGFSNAYPEDSDLSGGQCYPSLKRLGPAVVDVVGHAFVDFLFPLVICKSSASKKSNDSL